MPDLSMHRLKSVPFQAVPEKCALATALGSAGSRLSGRDAPMAQLAAISQRKPKGLKHTSLGQRPRYETGTKGRLKVCSIQTAVTGRKED